MALGKISADCFYPITEDLGCIAFAQHAIKQMKNKLQIYDRLLEIQWRSGGVNTVVLPIAMGTLIYLLS
jgi:hypothetical protein